MKLLIDMGNSRLKAAKITEFGLGDVFTSSYDGEDALQYLTSYLSRLSNLESVALVSVLGEVFEQGVKAYCLANNIHLVWVASTKAAQGVTSSYDKPATLGSDRFVALVGAIKQFPKQYCIVVDCGTAVTIDGLTADGEFQGGVILPGLQLWGQSLIGRANQLDDNNLTSPTLFAKNTADAIGGGSVFGLVGAIDGICMRMKQGYIDSGAEDSSIKLVLCGGDAALVARHSQLKFTLLPHLVLMGLAHYI